MRSIGLLGLCTFLLASGAAPAAAQEEPTPRSVEDADLPPDVARRIIDFFNDPETIHFTGSTRIPAERTVTGDVAVLGGPLEVGGRVDGSVVVINGSVSFLPGATVTGDVTVVGGAITGADEATVGGEMVSYSERLRYRREGDRIVWRGRGRPGEDAGRDAGRGAGREDEWSEESDEERLRRGRAEFIVATGQSYNRVEGLPITFGPVLETEGSNPLRLRAMGIFRTEDEDGPYSAPRWGYDARLEQFFGGNELGRVGVRTYQRVDPIEDWHLTKLENGLSTFFLHRDYRDHYRRRGWSVYAGLAPRESPLSATLEYRDERHATVNSGSPWTLFNNDDEWRPQPFVGSGKLRSVALTTKFDTRSHALDPSTGWYFEGELEQAVGGTLRRDAQVAFDPETGAFVNLPARSWDNFTHAFLDVRRYNRVNASSRLNLRFLAGGSLDGSSLPPQRQHALGGEGSLPGFALFSKDCGARGRRVDLTGGFTPEPGESHDPVVFFPGYGCDRFVLGQVEYRGDLSFRASAVDDWDDEDGDGEDDWNDGPTQWNPGIGWVLFADAGHGWSLDGFSDEDTAVDVGAGLLFGRLGLYVAMPVTGDGRSPNFFIRLTPRF